MIVEELPALLARLRAALVEEASPNPGQQLAYGRPHAHPRAKHYPRFSKTGERLAGSVRVRPDCPRPVKGRCECPPDGSWRPIVGVLRGDATARHATAVPASRLRPALEGQLWTDEVYEQGPDGLWRCRWPVRRALERQRGANPELWQAAVALLRGVAPATVFAVPDPKGGAERLLRRIVRWAVEESEREWERRPRQWWDAPRRGRANSEPQNVAEAADTASSPPDTGTLQRPPSACYTAARSVGPRASSPINPLRTRAGSRGSLGPNSVATASPRVATDCWCEGVGCEWCVLGQD